MDEYTEKSSSGGCAILGAVAVLIVVLALVVAGPVTSNLATVQTERTAATQAQAAAQQSAERERTERERLAQETARQNSQLRAEADGRTQNTATLILTAGLVILAGLLFGGLFMFGLNWYDTRTLQRTLLLLEAQRQAALAQADYLSLSERRVAGQLMARRVTP